MDHQFTSHAHQTIAQKKIKKYASQYDGVDMAALLGSDDENFPFLVRDGSGDYKAMWWCAYSGFNVQMDDDDVRAFALVQYLLDHAYPRFDSFEDAEKWSIAHKWPRKSRGGG